MIWRRIGGTLAGIIVAGLTIAAAEWLGHLLLGDGAAVSPDRLTLPMLLAVIVAWGLGALAGAMVAAAISRWRFAPQIVGLSVLLGIFANAMMMPQPLWMTAAGAVLVWLAARFAAARTEPEPAAA